MWVPFRMGRELKMKKTFVEHFTFTARKLRARALFRALDRFCSGDVLDVGGRDFFTVIRRRLNFNSWTTLEYARTAAEGLDDPRFRLVYGDGCAMPFAESAFDTVLNIQVLEHVMEPNRMVSEIARVLKPSGHAVFLIPQTAVLHELPAHYYNFTRFWIERAMTANGLRIVDLQPIGGVWSSMASHLVYFFFQGARLKGMSGPEFQRSLAFYLLLPFMVVYAAVSIPICLLFSLGDLEEEPNNHLVVVRKER